MDYGSILHYSGSNETEPWKKNWMDGVSVQCIDDTEKGKDKVKINMNEYDHKDKRNHNCLFMMVLIFHG